MAWWKKALDVVSAPLSQPKIFLTKGIGAASKEVAASRKRISSGKESGIKKIGTILASTAVVGASVYGGAAAITSARAGTLIPAAAKIAKSVPKRTFTVTKKATKSTVKAFIPKTILGKVAAGTSTIIGAGVLKSSPTARATVTKAIKAAPQQPAKIFTFGESVGDVIEGKTVFTKENVVGGLKTAGLVGGGVALAAAVIPKLGKEKAIEAAPSLAKEIAPSAVLVKDKATPTALTGTPKPVATQSATTTKKKRKYKRKAPMSMRQSVNVNIGNTKYIKHRYYG